MGITRITMNRMLRLFILLSALALPILALAQPEVIHWSARYTDDQPSPTGPAMVQVTAKIDAGWHLYALPPTKADNIPTTIQAVAPLQLGGKITQSKPIHKMDANFGAEVDYFEKIATFKVPVILPGGDAPSLTIRFQACNASTCLPPKTVTVPIRPKATGPVEWSARVVGDIVDQTATVEVTADIADNWHLYGLPPTKADNIPTTIEAVDPARLKGKPTQTKPIHKFDKNFGAEVDYFESSATFKVSVFVGEDGVKGKKLKVRYQACNDVTCLPPTSVEVPIDGSLASVAAPVAGQTTDDQNLAAAKSKGILPFMAFAFGAGLLALLTPCVFPMVPITVSFFAERREKHGSKSGLSQAAAYCGGIIGAFAAFGLIVTALFGATGIQQFATNPWINIAIGLLFVVLALNLFGFFEIKVPYALANKFSPSGKAGLLAPVFMGLTFTITSFTCTVPFVGTILVSAASGDWIYPLFGMLAFGTAFSLPFFLLALFPHALASLPRAGSWMAAVKGFMGFLEVAAALKFFSNSDLVWSLGIFSRERFLVIWMVIGLATLAFLVGVLKLPHVTMPKQLGKGRIAVMAATIAIVGWLGLGVAGRSLGELEAFLPPSHSGWIETYDQAQHQAIASNRPMFVNFTGVTCTNCRWMEKNMFPREDITDALKGYIKVELFTDRELDSDRANQALQQKLAGTVTLPLYLILSPDGRVLRKFESSTRDSSQFLAFLKSGAPTNVARR